MNIKNERKQFLYLFNFEIVRSFKLILPLFLLIFIGRITWFLVIFYDRRIGFYNAIEIGKETAKSFVGKFGYIYKSNIYNDYTDIAVFAIVAALITIALYSLFIWAKEWGGNNRTIYTLMTLPISKSTILLSKLTTCFMLFIIFCSTQIVSIIIEGVLFNIIIPKETNAFENFKHFIINSRIDGLVIITPKDMIFLSLGVLAGIILIFMTILLERSFGFKGILIMLLIGVGLGGVLIIPMIFNLYYLESIVYWCITAIFVIIGGFLLCKHLLENKVHV